MEVGLQHFVARIRNGLAAPATDAELLQKFVQNQDESAFDAIVARHGQKVYAVCRRLLGQHQLAEDAYQATFFVLAKKAHSIQPASAVGGFLYGVARKAALEALALKRRRKEQSIEKIDVGANQSEANIEQDILLILDEEIANLSETLRTAVTLCEIDGHSRAEAAKRLGIAEGTLSSRLAAARKSLAKKLKNRGVVLSAGLFVSLAESIKACPLLHASLNNTNLTVNAIAGNIMKSFILGKLKLITVGVLFIVGIGSIGMLPGRKTDMNLAANAFASAPIPIQSQSWYELSPIEFKEGNVTCISATGDGEHFAICRDTGDIHYYNTKTREQIKQLKIENTIGMDFSLAFRQQPDPEKGEIFGITSKKGFMFGNISNGLLSSTNKVPNIPASFNLGYDINPCQILWLKGNDEENRIAFSTVDNQVYHPKFDINGMTIESYYKSESVNKKQLLLGIPDTNTLLCYINKGVSIHENYRYYVQEKTMTKAAESKESYIGNHDGHKTDIIDGAIAQDGRTLITCDQSGLVICWRLKLDQAGKIDLYYILKKFEFGEPEQTIKKQKSKASVIIRSAMSPDGKTIAIIKEEDDKQYLFVFDLGENLSDIKPLAEYDFLKKDSTNAASLLFSKDGKYLFAATNEKKDNCIVHLWKRNETRPIKQFDLTQIQLITRERNKDKIDCKNGIIYTQKLYDHKISYYNTSGIKIQELSTIHANVFRGINENGTKLALLANKGKFDDEIDNHTIHIFQTDDLSKWVDTGIKPQNIEFVQILKDKTTVLRTIVDDNHKSTKKIIPGYNFDYRIYDINTKKETKIQFEPNTLIHAESPDGQSWYCSQLSTDEKKPGLRYFCVPKKGGKAEILFENYYFKDFIISNDGKSFLCVGRPILANENDANKLFIYIYDIESRKITELEELENTGDLNVIWSPDDKQYLIKKDYDKDVYLFDIATKKRKKLFEMEKIERIMGWSDGKHFSGQ